MGFPRKRRNWKRVHPRNLREAFRLCKDHGRETRNLSVERISELMGVSDDLLYKWLANGEMRASLIPAFEHVCGIHMVTEYLAAGANRIVIEIPTGRCPVPLRINEVQVVFTEAIRELIQFWEGDADQAETEDALTAILKALAWHRENVHKGRSPELELADGGEQ